MIILFFIFILQTFSFDVNGMLQLDFITNDGAFVNRERTWKELQLTKEMGFDGVMCDIWWGIVEKSPRQYKWDVYLDLVGMVHKLGLRFQPVMSFHQCGGNVGDTCDIKIPEWVRKQAKQKKAGFYLYNGGENYEYLNFNADSLVLDELDRTPIDMYYEFMKAFNDAFKKYIDYGTIDEVQVGTGPCGETRYPGYAASLGWVYPQIGEFVINDPYSMEDLARYAKENGHPEWYTIPKGLGNLTTDSPDKTNFFAKEYKSSFGENHFTTERGQFFLKWYATSMIEHTDRVMAQARRAFGTKLPLANKVAGIHWWFDHPSRCAEATTGYVILKDKTGKEIYNAYTHVHEVLAKHGARMTFTCMEMLQDTPNSKPPYEKTWNNPPGLIEFVFKSAPNVEVRGENAIEVVGVENGSMWKNDLTFAQLKKQLSKQTRMTGITLLRLQKYMFEYQRGIDTFTQLVDHAHQCGGKGDENCAVSNTN